MGSDRVMKDSGVEWIGDIPEDWELRRLKLTVDLINDKTEYNGQTYIGLENIESGCGKYLETENQTIDGVSNSFSTGDILFGKLRPYLAKCIIAPCDGLCSSELLVIRNFKGNQQFLFWTLLSHWFINIVDASTYGAKMPRASWNFIRDLKICYPSRPGQNRIASFLNTKCSQIDSTIHKEREVIDKLKEYRQAVITEAVTKGIRAGVPMKDSGVEWIGEIPEHWNCVDFRRAVHLKQGLQIEQTKRFSDNGDNRFVYITLKYVNSIKSPEDTEYIENPDSNVMCDYGDILFVRTGATGLIVTNVFGVYHNNFFKIIFDKKLISKRYLIDYLSQKSIQAHFNLLAGTTTIPDLNHGDFLSTKVLIPPLPEQQEIADYLDKKCSEIDATIQKRELAIEKLTAYKQSLIYECVTGKKEVLG